MSLKTILKNRNMKHYTENDEIELRLVNCAGAYYDLEWRYKKPHKFLFFNVKDGWKILPYYDTNIYFSADEDPDSDLRWHNIIFNLGKKSDVDEYEKLKKTVKTKKDLYNFFHIQEKLEVYKRHQEEHDEWLEMLEGNIAKHVK